MLVYSFQYLAIVKCPHIFFRQNKFVQYRIIENTLDIRFVHSNTAESFYLIQTIL